MEGVITMQNRFTNWVYVVSLGSDIPEWSDISWIDIANKKLKYFYPFDHKSWPNEPPNYIAFRYYSKLQSIHHIERYQVAEEMHSNIPEIKAGAWEPHFLFDLGKPFRPDHDVPTGPRIKRANRVWVLLDTLFTSDTISDALTETEKRKAQEDN